MPMKTNLKLRRLERDMKQSDLADLVNVRRETIGRLEQGQYCPSLRLAMDIARVFGTTVEDLFSFDDEYEQERQATR
ncbi:helix-turn-helix transcriptional regulator [Bifidobacterium pullorum]|uniref:helix-turn-helix transcriptional regulator n=1 Tax=Bifidobacterium pullorum TaxID=78448 RepID=UPI003A8F25D1